MSALDQLSEEQLERLIAAKKSQMTKEEISFPKKDERGLSDSLRDIVYGGIKGGLWEPGKFLGNLVTGGNLKNIPGYNQYIPFMDKLIESIESPNKSEAGETLKTISEFAPIGAGTAKLGYRGLKSAYNALPPLTKKAEQALYDAVRKKAEEEGVQGLSHPNEIIRQTHDFFSSQKVPVGERLTRASSGEFDPALDIKNNLGQLSRSLESAGPRLGAQNLRADWIDSLLKSLESKGFLETKKELELAEKEFARGKKYKDLFGKTAKKAGKYGIIYEGIKHL